MKTLKIQNRKTKESRNKTQGIKRKTRNKTQGIKRKTRNMKGINRKTRNMKGGFIYNVKIDRIDKEIDVAKEELANYKNNTKYSSWFRFIHYILGTNKDRKQEIWNNEYKKKLEKKIKKLEKKKKEYEEAEDKINAWSGPPGKSKDDINKYFGSYKKKRQTYKFNESNPFGDGRDSMVNETETGRLSNDSLFAA